MLCYSSITCASKFHTVIRVVCKKNFFNLRCVYNLGEGESRNMWADTSSRGVIFPFTVNWSWENREEIIASRQPTQDVSTFISSGIFNHNVWSKRTPSGFWLMPLTISQYKSTIFTNMVQHLIMIAQLGVVRSCWASFKIQTIELALTHPPNLNSCPSTWSNLSSCFAGLGVRVKPLTLGPQEVLAHCC